MRARLSYIEDRLRNSFWFTPALMMVVAVLVAIFTLSLDDYLTNADVRQVPGLHTVVYSGGPDGAREVLGAIAASMITVAGVVFSITIVALTLASNQFGPRLLENFMRDRGNQVTLGTFIAAFLYSLLVLRTIRSDQPESVPDISVTIALLLAIGGLAVLIYFIHHVAMTIQAPNLVARIGAELRHGIDHVFPDTDATEQAQPAPSDDLEERLRSGTPCDVPAGGSGYVQVIDLDGLVETARKHDLLIRLEVGPGRFVVPSTTFAQVWPADRVDDEVCAAIGRTLVTGARRTPIQDVEFPVRQLAEVAVRSLSPGINDPYTAETCVDQLSVGLCRLADRPFPPERLADGEGTVRVVVGDPVTFERMIQAGFDQIRQCADFHAPVYAHLLAALTRIAERVQDPARLEPLRAQGRLVLEAAERAVPAAEDRRAVHDGHAALVAAAATVEPLA